MNEFLSNAFWTCLETGISTVKWMNGDLVYPKQKQIFWYKQSRIQSIFNSDFRLSKSVIPHITWYYRYYELVDWLSISVSDTVLEVVPFPDGILLRKYKIVLLDLEEPYLFVDAEQNKALWTLPILSASLYDETNCSVLWDVTESLVSLLSMTKPIYTLSELSGYLLYSNGIHSIPNLTLKVLIDDSFEEIEFKMGDIVTHNH